MISEEIGIENFAYFSRLFKAKQDYRRETFVNSADSYNMYVIFQNILKYIDKIK